jgi:hypothetical protein
MLSIGKCLLKYVRFSDLLARYAQASAPRRQERTQERASLGKTGILGETVLNPATYIPSLNTYEIKSTSSAMDPEAQALRVLSKMKLN